MAYETEQDIRERSKYMLKIGSSDADFDPSLVSETGSATFDAKLVVKSLQNDNCEAKCSLIRDLGDKLADLTPTSRVKLLDVLINNINFSDTGNLRTESLRLISQILNLRENIDSNTLKLIYRNLLSGLQHHPAESDLKYITNCFEELIRLSEPLQLVQLENMDTVFLALFNEANEMRNYKIILSICNIIAKVVRINSTLLETNTLENILNILIKLNDAERVTVDQLFAFNIFFLEFMKIDEFYKTKMLTILSIVGHGYIAKDISLKEQSQKILQRLIQADVSGTIYGICDVIDCRRDPNIRCLKKLKSDIIGCIRMLMSLGNEILDNFGKHEQEEIKMFFDKGNLYLMRCLFNAAKLKDVDISEEIIKYFVQMLETPYIISVSYRVMVEQSLFWDILKELCLSDPHVMHSIEYLSVQTELFNKLQNLNLSDYTKRRLFEYFELNSDHISSYNIDYVLRYYENMNMCVCGVLNWKQNCLKIIQEYYATSPYRAFNVLKKAFFYCLSLKIDNESIQFYIHCICYLCVINLPIQLTDEICDPLSEVIMSLDIVNFEKVICDYEREIQNIKDINLIFIVKTVIVCALKSIDDCVILKRKHLLITSLKLASLTHNFQNQQLFLFPILLLLKLRVTKNGIHKVYFIKELTSYNLKVTKLNSNTSNRSPEYNQIDGYLDQMIRERFYDTSFDNLVEKYFKDGRTEMFEEDLELAKVLDLYKCILCDTTRADNYLLVLLHLKEQMLNCTLFDSGCEQAITEIAELFCLQMQKIYEFKFALPYWLDVDHLRAMIVSTLYGFIPYKKLIPGHTLQSLLRTIILDFHFTSFTTDAYVNFINCCLYELPEIMKYFIHSIMKVIVSDSNKPETHFAGLEFVYNILNLRGFYELGNKETDLVIEYLNNVYSFSKTDDNCIYKKVCENFCLLIHQENDLKNLAFSKIPLKIKVSLKIEIETNDENLISIIHRIEDTFKVTSKDEESEILVVITDSENHGISEEGKKILIQKILKESTFYNVTSLGFEFINIRDIIIDAINIERYIENLIKISSICNEGLK